MVGTTEHWKLKAGGEKVGLISGRLRCCMFLVVNSTELLFNGKNFKYFTFMEEQRDDY